MIGVVLDANVFISYLLAPDRSTAVQRCVELGISGAFELIIPEPLLAELTRKIAEKPYLAARISQEELGQLVGILFRMGVVIPRLEDSIPRLSREDKDDYLLAYARAANADYLVTGDNDLLVLRSRIDRPAIRTPAEFVRELAFVPSEDDQQGSVGLRESVNEEI
jgi:putative PIN family toxin of toxin-antitoxin system